MPVQDEPSVARSARAIDTDTEVETPEYVRFRYRTAGPTRRLVAYAIDLLIRGAVLLVVGVALGLTSAIEAKNFADAASGLILVTLFVLEWGYYVLFETLWD